MGLGSRTGRDRPLSLLHIPFPCLSTFLGARDLGLGSHYGGPDGPSPRHDPSRPEDGWGRVESGVGEGGRGGGGSGEGELPGTPNVVLIKITFSKGYALECRGFSNVDSKDIVGPRACPPWPGSRQGRVSPRV